MTPKIGGGKVSYTAYRDDKMVYSDTREVFVLTSAPIGAWKCNLLPAL